MKRIRARLIILFFLLLYLPSFIKAENKKPLIRDFSYINYSEGISLELKSNRGEDHFIIFNRGLKEFKDVLIEFDAIPQNSDSQFGVITRFKNENNWTYFGCDLTSDIFGNSHWFARNAQGNEIKLTSEISKFFKNYKRHIMVKQVDEVVSIYIDGECIIQTALDKMSNLAGQIGLRVLNGGNLKIENLKIKKASAASFNNAQAGAKLENEDMAVVFTKNYPSVYSYKLKSSNTSLLGSHKTSNEILVNGELYKASTHSELSKNGIRFTSHIAQLGVKIITEFSISNTILHMNIVEIIEPKGFKVNTFAYPNQALITVKNSDKQASLSIANATVSDDFIALQNRPIDRSENYANIAILNTSNFAATIDNNSIYNTKEIAYRTYIHKNEKYTSIYGNEWIVRDMNGDRLTLPSQKVVIAQDVNRDQIIDWQDAAYALVQVKEEPYGADLIRNAYATITMNFASGAQFPFLRQLDNIKKFYNISDGFGQMLNLKGYQSEGHDSAHPDYAGNYNTRAGGLKDLQILTKEAKKYGAHIGVHINHSESYPEAKAYDNEIVSDIPAWKWLDQSFLINKKLDINRGTFNARINTMKADLPDLSFVYLDTYREYRTVAAHTAKSFVENGWAIWTEEPNIFMKSATWVHYEPESKSRISRFVHHKYRDGYAYDPLFLGGYNRGAAIGFMGWQNGKDFNGTVKNFFTLQLPYRYLMHHGVRKITDNEIFFDENINSTAVNGVNIIKQDGRLVKSGELIFIPWEYAEESKIYHYNSQGGETRWTLPKTWEGVKQVKLYKLTTQGRIWVKDISIDKDHSLILNAEPLQGYVLYKKNAQPLKSIKWGEFSFIENPGFDGELQGWTAKGDQIKTIKTSYGQYVLSIEKSGEVSQTLNLEKGKTYILSAWVEVTGKGRAELSIGQYKQAIYESSVKNFIGDSDKNGTRFHRLKIPFTYDGIHSELKLSFNETEANSSARFDDLRILETRPTQKEGYNFFEDFEAVDEGWGPFTPSRQLGKTHLSELHEGYTDDTLNGQFSLKTWNEGNGEIYRTSPAQIQFKPNTKYQVELDYKVTEKEGYRLVVRSQKDNKDIYSKALNSLNQEHLDFQFTTLNQDDYYICVMKKGNGTLIIDNFGIKGELNQ